MFFYQYVVAPILSQYIVLYRKGRKIEREKTKTAKMSEDKKINKIVKTGRDKKKGQKKLTKIKRRERKGDEEK